MTPATLVTPVPLRPLPEKAFRRRKAGRYSVKKSVLFERSEFTDFRNIAWLFSPRIEMETVLYSYESRSLVEQVSVLEALGLDLLFTFVAMVLSPLGRQSKKVHVIMKYNSSTGGDYLG